MFRIKICGITNVDDALDTADAGADAIGLNFYRGSKRFVDLPTAKAISVSLPAGVKKVGVFVNADAAEIASITKQVGLDAIQLHGDEPAQFLGELPSGVPIIRAFRCGDTGVAPLVEYLAECASLGKNLAGVLIDSQVGDQYGGTGVPSDWFEIGTYHNAIGTLPLILSGGLTPTNVAEAIELALPHAVDVASGVERGPGRKDPVRVRHFIAEAGRMLDSVQRQ